MMVSADTTSSGVDAPAGPHAESIAVGTPSDVFRREVRALLAEHLPEGWQGFGALSPADASVFTAVWRKALHEHGLLAVTWPEAYGGGGRSSAEQVVLGEELARVGLPVGAPNDVFGIQMLGSTLLQWGTEAQRRRLLPRILRGDDVWCQGFSEPGAGSDLAALTTRADRDGDDWVITGQKTWTSGAHSANWIFVLARTGPAAGHRGVSFLLCPLEQPGVDIRPIRTMAGEAEFNEVFFTEARTHASNVVGEVGGGWSVAMTLLGHERGSSAAVLAVRFRAELQRLVTLARDRGVATDPRIRQRLASCHSSVAIMSWLAQRAASQDASGVPCPAPSIFKLVASEHHQRVTELALDILGADGTRLVLPVPSVINVTDEPNAPNTIGSWVGSFLNARAVTIYAGTSEIQRSILAEQMLGLPREPR